LERYSVQTRGERGKECRDESGIGPGIVVPVESEKVPGGKKAGKKKPAMNQS